MSLAAAGRPRGQQEEIGGAGPALRQERDALRGSRLPETRECRPVAVQRGTETVLGYRGRVRAEPEALPHWGVV